MRIARHIDDPVEARSAVNPLTKLLVSKLEHTGSCLNKREKLVPCFFLTERTQHGSPYHHAQMSRFNDHPDA